MTFSQRASWRRPAPASVRLSAGASGIVHVAVLAVAIFGYPVFDIVFAPLSGTPQDVLAQGDADRLSAAGAASALDIHPTETGLQTAPGIDAAHDVPTDSSGTVGYTVVGDTPKPQKRAGRPDTRPTPPVPRAADPTRRGKSDGQPDGTSVQLAAREILVMVTLQPERPDRLDGSDAGKERIADADGTDDGEDARAREAARAALAPGTTPTGDAPPAALAASAQLPGAAHPAHAIGAATGSARPRAKTAAPEADAPVARSGPALQGVAVLEQAAPMTEAPRAGGLPAPAYAVARAEAREATGDADDDRKERFEAIVFAVTGADERFARAILEPRPNAPAHGLPDPAKQQRIRLLQAAAEAGYARAQFALARRYIIGEQPQATMRESIELLREAAERGDVDAQLLLGVIYAQGEIARRDLVEAQFYLSLAAAQGAPDVERVVADIERDMTLEQIIAARRFGKTYRKLLHALTMPKAEGTRGDLLRDELLDAAAAGNTARIARALARGGDLEAADSAGRTAIINAAWRGRADAIDLLLDIGADVDASDDRGRTALTWAASNGHAAIVDRLVAAGAAIDAVDADGTTALMRAAWNGHREIVDTLIGAGASVARSDRTGLTAIDYAARSGNPAIATSMRKVGI